MSTRLHRYARKGLLVRRDVCKFASRAHKFGNIADDGCTISLNHRETEMRKAVDVPRATFDTLAIPVRRAIISHRHQVAPILRASALRQFEQPQLVVLLKAIDAQNLPQILPLGRYDARLHPARGPSSVYRVLPPFGKFVQYEWQPPWVRVGRQFKVEAA